MLENPLAVLVAAVAAFLIGALWYSPVLFAKAWVNAHGHTPEKLAAMQAKAGRAYVGSFLAMLVMASLMNFFFNYLHTDSLHDGALWAVHMWIGFALPLGVSAHLFSDRRAAALFIDLGYQLVYMTVMGMILGSWR